MSTEPGQPHNIQNGTGGLVTALALTLDQHLDGFLQDFEQNAARIFDHISDKEGVGSDTGGALLEAGYLAQLVLREDLEHGRRRGIR